MKLLLLSDLQGINHDDWRELIEINATLYDVTILLGDIEDLLLITIKERFSGKPLFGILGNHDNEGDLEYYEIDNIHGRRVTIDNISFTGLKGSVRYKPGDAPMLTQNEARIYCNALEPVDIIISHNSPKGIHDKHDKAHEGFEGLLDYIKEHQPKYAIHGHQHQNRVSMVGDTYVIGVYGGVIFDTQSREVKHVLRVAE